MRSHDYAELWELTRTGPEEAVRRSINMSQESYIGYWNGTPACVFGCFTAYIGMVGVPWFLGTDEVTEHPVAFLRWARRYVTDMKARHTLLQNIVHSQNTPSVVFLTALGFELGETYLTDTGATARVFSMQGLLDV